MIDGDLVSRVVRIMAFLTKGYKFGILILPRVKSYDIVKMMYVEVNLFPFVCPTHLALIIIPCENPQALGLPLLSFKEKLVRLLGPGKE